MNDQKAPAWLVGWVPWAAMPSGMFVLGPVLGLAQFVSVFGRRCFHQAPRGWQC